MAFTKVTRPTETINTGFGRFNTLIDDLLSVSNAKGASQIGIEDTAGNMTATNVEDALAEIYSDTSTTQTLAETFAENPTATTGLTWGYKGGLFRKDNVVTTITDDTVSLTDNSTNYVEINTSSVVVVNTTGFTNGRVPIRQITTVSGSQTVSTDKRAWFSVEAIGVAVNDLVQLVDANGSPGFPAIVGAKLADINEYGLVPSNGSDADHDINVTAGVIRDSTRTKFLKLPTELTKQIDAESAFVAGDDQPGFYTTSAPANTTWYYVYIIENTTTLATDIYIDISATAENKPSGYGLFACVGKILTDDSANILPFNAVETEGSGIDYDWDAGQNDVNGATWGTAQTSVTLSAPINSTAKVYIEATVGSGVSGLVVPTSFTDVVPDSTTRNGIINSDPISYNINIRVDDSSQIAVRLSATATASSCYARTFGFIDGRI